MDSELMLALFLFFVGLIVFIIMGVMIYYYDRKYYGKDKETKPEKEEGED